MPLPNPFRFLSSLSHNNRQAEGLIEVNENTIHFAHVALVVSQIARVQLLRSAVSPLWPTLAAAALLLLGILTSSIWAFGFFAWCAAYAAVCWWISRRRFVTISSSDGHTVSIITRSQEFQSDVYRLLMKKMNEPHLKAVIDMSRKSINVSGSVAGPLVMGDGNFVRP